MTPDGSTRRPSHPDADCPDCGAPIGAATTWHEAHGYRHGFVCSHVCRVTGLVWVYCNGYVPDHGYIDCHARASGPTLDAALAAIGA